jgi:hypothetical protein
MHGRTTIKKKSLSLRSIGRKRHYLCVVLTVAYKIHKLVPVINSMFEGKAI